jgi:hypothetical protein
MVSPPWSAALCGDVSTVKDSRAAIRGAADPWSVRETTVVARSAHEDEQTVTTGSEDPMGTKKVDPKNPERAVTDGKDASAATRKTGGMKFPRKTGRKTVWRRNGGG